MVDNITQFCTNNPALIGQPFFANLRFTTTFTSWMDEFNAVSVNQTYQTMFRHENLCPMAVRVEQTKEASSFW
jgi:hypothetical protein